MTWLTRARCRLVGVAFLLGLGGCEIPMLQQGLVQDGNFSGKWRVERPRLWSGERMDWCDDAEVEITQTADTLRVSRRSFQCGTPGEVVHSPFLNLENRSGALFHGSLPAGLITPTTLYLEVPFTDEVSLQIKLYPENLEMRYREIFETDEDGWEIEGRATRLSP